jgi:arylsulfatase A-like enzyme
VKIPGNTRPDFGVTRMGESPENQEERWNMAGRAVYSQDLFDRKCVEFIRANRDRPFFLFHPSQLPHGPISIPAIHPSVAGNPALTQYEKEYASMVLRLDQTVGIMLDELQRLGIDEDTMVMFAADNGHECYYHQEGRCNPERNIRTGQAYDNITTRFTSEQSGDVFNGNDGMSGKKWHNWEGGTRIAAMARWPGHVTPGRTSDRLIANYDFLPTVAEMVGAPCPPGKDGVSFLPELLGKADPGQGHEHVMTASGLGPAIVTREGWKLRFIRLPRENHYQLYHLPDDYREEHDLIAEGPRETVNHLSTVMLRECDGNYSNGMPDAHHVWLPGWEFFGPECDWRMRE